VTHVPHPIQDRGDNRGVPEGVGSDPLGFERGASGGGGRDVLGEQVRDGVGAEPPTAAVRE